MARVAANTVPRGDRQKSFKISMEENTKAAASLDAVKTLLALIEHSVPKRQSSHDDAGFNVFKLCSVNHYETIHSRIIAELLNPKGSHGLGKTFLELFLDQQNVKHYLERNKFPLGQGDLGTVRTHTEESLDDGRCDITLHWCGYCIVIENKIYARDQDAQLQRYQDSLQKQNEKPLLFYLTLDGHVASKESLGNLTESEYCCLSYVKDITQWIEASAKASYRNPFVRETLCQYLNLIKDLCKKQKGIKMNEHVVGAIKSSAGAFRASCAIAGSLQNARGDIANMIVGSIKQIIDKEERFSGWKLYSTISNFVKDTGFRHIYWHGFEIRNENFPYALRCEFQEKGALRELFIGLKKSESVKEEDVKRFLDVAKKSIDNNKYDFYSYSEVENIGWLYGSYPRGASGEFRNWSDDVLADLIDDTQRFQFAQKIADYMYNMLAEAAEVAVGDKGR